MRAWQKWAVLAWLACGVSYNALVVGVWWCGMFNGGICRVRLMDINEHIFEGMIWHATLAVGPWAMVALIRMMFRRDKPDATTVDVLP